MPDIAQILAAIDRRLDQAHTEIASLTAARNILAAGDPGGGAAARTTRTARTVRTVRAVRRPGRPSRRNGHGQAAAAGAARTPDRGPEAPPTAAKPLRAAKTAGKPARTTPAAAKPQRAARTAAKSARAARTTPAAVTPRPAADAAAKPVATEAPLRATRSRRGPRAGRAAERPEQTIEALLRDSADGMSAVALSKRAGMGYARVLTRLRELEATGTVASTGSHRTSLWRLVTDEDRIAQRVAELEQAAAKS